ncbi:polyketide cyclase [Rhodococcoides trifolii]|uniref:Polyketide cyclase n=1 Tax=Rhodococcoides trifolii TaxID=908250 RepID=A0A917FNV0_9NOCA|nr:SRPBCC family protein [Rhodococcus trifolii]GGF94749.1 polyketide cyclase [Rhodococcus trifolii]
MSKSLSATIDVDASPAAVWTVVSDLKRMSEWSPQCRVMKVLGGDVKVGARTINLNQRGPLFWPTSSKILRFEENTALAFRVVENHTVWSYTLEEIPTGTRVTERREAPGGTSGLSNFLVARVLGGIDEFDDELVAGMNATLRKIKNAAERTRTVEA